MMVLLSHVLAVVCLCVAGTRAALPVSLANPGGAPDLFGVWSSLNETIVLINNGSYSGAVAFDSEHNVEDSLPQLNAVQSDFTSWECTGTPGEVHQLAIRQFISNDGYLGSRLCVLFKLQGDVTQYAVDINSCPDSSIFENGKSSKELDIVAINSMKRLNSTIEYPKNLVCGNEDEQPVWNVTQGPSRLPSNAVLDGTFVQDTLLFNPSNAMPACGTSGQGGVNGVYYNGGFDGSSVVEATIVYQGHVISTGIDQTTGEPFTRLGMITECNDVGNRVYEGTMSEVYFAGKELEKKNSTCTLFGVPDELSISSSCDDSSNILTRIQSIEESVASSPDSGGQQNSSPGACIVSAGISLILLLSVLG
ncbi:hypothetical protein M9434_005554 [Picochlorum sp. BPE23]|nr:hypothetical protein M9434_005554 [Picochlorum sp. BPE23]